MSFSVNAIMILLHSQCSPSRFLPQMLQAPSPRSLHQQHIPSLPNSPMITPHPWSHPGTTVMLRKKYISCPVDSVNWLLQWRDENVERRQHSLLVVTRVEAGCNVCGSYMTKNAAMINWCTASMV